MRTTVRLDDGLLAAVKKLAAETGRSLTAVIEDALRQVLARGRAEQAKPVRLTTFKGDGLRPGIHLDNSAALLQEMEKNDDAR